MACAAFVVGTGGVGIEIANGVVWYFVERVMSFNGIWIVVALVVVGFFVFQSRGLAEVEDIKVKALMGQGAVVIDVRTPAEYEAQNIPVAKNVPLGEVAAKIEEVVPDKQTPILCHCRSGVRSGKAMRILKKMGYREVHNLGSFERSSELLKD